MSHCVNTLQLRLYKGPTGSAYDLDSFTDDELQAALDEAEEVVENLTRDKFYTLSETWRLDGSGTDILRFPPRIPYPLLSITSVDVIDVDKESQDSLDEDEDYVNGGHFLKVGPIGETGAVRSTVGRYGTWPQGIQNIEIVGLWGWSECPKSVARAIKLLALEVLSPGITQMDRGDRVQESWPDYTVTYRTAGGGNQAALTGFLPVDRILARYVNNALMFVRGADDAYLVSSEAEPTEAAGTGVQVLENDPNFPDAGDFWYNSTDRVWKGYDGSDVTTWGVASVAVSPLPSEETPRGIKTYAGDPVDPDEGDIWFNSNDGKMKGWNGVTTIEFGPGVSEGSGPTTDTRYIGVFVDDPDDPSAGDFWFNSTDALWRFYDGANTVTWGVP